MASAPSNVSAASLHMSFRPTDVGQLTWLPYKETAGEPGHPALASFSDHLFLLRNGVPVGRLGFDVLNTVDDPNEKIDNGNNSNGSGNIAVHSSISNNNTNDGDNKKSYGSQNNINNDDNDNNDQTLCAVGIGRGYDASIPAVFKAKVTRARYGAIHCLEGVEVVEHCAASMVGSDLHGFNLQTER